MCPDTVRHKQSRNGQTTIGIAVGRAYSLCYTKVPSTRRTSTIIVSLWLVQTNNKEKMSRIQQLVVAYNKIIGQHYKWSYTPIVFFNFFYKSYFNQGLQIFFSTPHLIFELVVFYYKGLLHAVKLPFWNKSLLKILQRLIFPS